MSNMFKNQRGFTLVEMLVVAPIVILAIGAFLTVIISMTGEVIASRTANTLTFNMQDSLSRIEQDVKLSTNFLATNSIALPAANAQGYNDDGTAFTNVGGVSGTVLILDMVATVTDPSRGDGSLVYRANQPNSCESAEVFNNTLMNYNVVYFVKNNTLWRRTIMPSDYASSSVYCATPWQRPSCSPAYTATFCATEDVKLVEGVSQSDFSIDYFNDPSQTTPTANASDESLSDAIRQNSLDATQTVDVSIRAIQLVAGRTIEETASRKSTRLAITSINPINLPNPPSVPIVSSSLAPGAQATFSWPVVPDASGYTFEYRISGGPWQTGFANQNSLSYTVQAPSNQETVDVRVFSLNSKGRSDYGTNSVAIPLWETLPLQNGWSTYASTFSSPAYTKTRDGIVMVKGLIKRTGTYNTGELVATLPAGYRPSNGLMFGGISCSASSRIDVSPAGPITFSVGHCSTWSSLESIRFVAAGSHPLTVVPSLQNGWTNFGAGSLDWQTASHYKDSNGRVWIQGLLRPGTTADNTIMFPMPAGRVTTQFLHMPARSSGYSGVSADSAGIRMKGPGNSSGYHTINAMYYADGATWTNMSSLGGGWQQYPGFSTAAFIKGTDNVVTLKGLLRSGSTTAGTVIYTLPVGYRPLERTLLTNISNHTAGRVDIRTDGQITFELGSNTWYSLDGLSFMAEQ